MVRLIDSFMSYRNKFIFSGSSINGLNIYLLKNKSILDVASDIGIEIPRFCFNKKLSVAGNCRMCLVEVVGLKKPVVSCIEPLLPGMHVLTNSVLVRKIREGILQFLLINHPLDCPVCDQGGECDLQEQSISFGINLSKFSYNKGKVSNINIGNSLKMVMDRCIKCTRCLRYLNNVEGLGGLGIVGRGVNTEILSYFGDVLKVGTLGNLSELCPVGAITLKSTSQSYRSWEFSTVNSLDVFDFFLTDIRLDIKGNMVTRICSVDTSTSFNNWISDSVRECFNDLFFYRTWFPLAFNKSSSSMSLLSWSSVGTLLKGFFNTFFMNDFLLGTSDFFCVLDDYLDLGSLFFIKNISFIFNNSYFLGSNLNNSFLVDFRHSYLLSNELSIFDNMNSCFMVGNSFNSKSAIFNLKLRGSYLKNNSLFFVISSFFKSIFPKLQVGSSIEIFYDFVLSNSFFKQYFLLSKNNYVFLSLDEYSSERLESFKMSLLSLSSTYFLSNIFNISFSSLSSSTNELNILSSDFDFKSSVSTFKENSFFLKAESLFVSYSSFWSTLVSRGSSISCNSVSFKCLYLLSEPSLGSSTSFTDSSISLLGDSSSKSLVIWQSSKINSSSLDLFVDVFLPHAHFLEDNALFIDSFGFMKSTVSGVDSISLYSSSDVLYFFFDEVLFVSLLDFINYVFYSSLFNLGTTLISLLPYISQLLAICLRILSFSYYEYLSFYTSIIKS